MIVLFICFTVSCTVAFGGGEGGGQSGNTGPTVRDEANWTVMFYSNADNNLESYIMRDMAEIKSAVRNEGSINLVTLIDRAAKYSTDSSVFGEDFEGSRLYEFRESGILRLGGGDYFPDIEAATDAELDLGSIDTLKNFILFAKHYYPARHTALVIEGHGSGIGDYPMYSERAVSYDNTSESYIPLRDFNLSLDAEESVELIVFDACYQNYVEIAYQIAPVRQNEPATGFSAQWMVASPAEVIPEGFAYDRVLENYYAYTESYPDSSPDGCVMGNFFLKAQREYRDATYGIDTDDAVGKLMTYSLLDLTKVDAFKTELDGLSGLIANQRDEAITAVFGNIGQINITNSALDYYFSPGSKLNWVYYPGGDARSLLRNLGDDETFSSAHTRIESCLTALDALVSDSFGSTNQYPSFVEGVSGLALFFPKGNLLYFSNPVWSYQTWYGPDFLAWCADGLARDSGTIGNWYDLLESWW